MRDREDRASSPEDAVQTSVETRVAEKSLREVIEIAFTEILAKFDEISVVRWIAERPGASYWEVYANFGASDLSLVIDDLIARRTDYFRQLPSSGTQATLLLQRTHSTDSSRYELRPEAIAAFTALGLLEAQCEHVASNDIANPPATSLGDLPWSTIRSAWPHHSQS